MASENLENKKLNKPDPLEIKTFDLNSSSMIEASAELVRLLPLVIWWYVFY